MMRFAPSMRRHTANNSPARLLLLLALAGAPAGCCRIFPALCETNFAAPIDRAITAINENSASWQTVLQRLPGQLSSEVSATIRNDVQNLASRSIAQAGTTFECSTTALARHAVRALERIAVGLRGRPVPPPDPPVFCVVAPAQITLNDEPARWPTITFHGYDLDSRDAAGRLVEVALVNAAGEETPLDDTLVGRTTHYQLTVNLGTSACALHRQNIRKVVLRYGGHQMGSTAAQGEAVVVPWSAQSQDVRASLNATTYTPPRTRGDGDFDTGGSDPMTVNAWGEAELASDAQRINVRVYLRAHEPRDDWTTAEGTSAWGVAYEAPANWRITSYAPNARSDVSASITTHGEQTYQRPGGEIVRSFSVFGDTDGDEAGTWTHVVAYWRDIDVHLVERNPRHLCPTP